MTWQRTAETAVELPYQGTVGKTRSESVQAWMPGGSFRTVHVYVSLDASADPALAKAAREGGLHAVTDGVELAVPFVYHDPDIALFLLVIPEGLRHRALELRAELMAQVAAEAQHEVVAYVAAFECVVGASGLRARIAEGRSGRALAWSQAGERAASEREDALNAWERNLRRRERELEEQLSVVRTSRPSVVGGGEEFRVERASLGLVSAFTGATEAVPFSVDSDNDGVVDVTDEDLLEDVSALYQGPPPLPHAELSRPALGSDHLPPMPAEFANDPSRSMCAVVDGGRVWLYVRGLPAGVPRGELELLLQVEPDARPPVVLITMVHGLADREPTVRRHPVRYLEPCGLAVLNLLAERFAVELVYAMEGGSLSYEATLEAPREGNARAVLAHLEAVGSVDPERYAEAEQQLLKEPPPWRDLSHPFVTWSDEEQVRSATEAAIELDELSAWSTPARQQRLSLLLSVPAERVRQHTSRAIRDALGFGLTLPEPLVDHALARGIADDEDSLFCERIAGLLRTSSAEDGGGMGTSVLATLWAEALEEASRRGLPLDDDAVLVAQKFLGDGKAHAKLRGLKSNSQANEPLLKAIGADKPDIRAAQTLIGEGGHRELLAVCEAAGRLTPAEAAAVFVGLAQRGEEAHEALRAEVSRAADVQRAFGAALALSVQRASGALEWLARGVRNAEAPLWTGFAFALGHYGGGSFRAVTRAMGESRLRGERAAHVYAHLSLHGARSQVRRLARATDPGLVEVGARAEELVAQWRMLPAHARGLEKNGELAVFSREFHERWRKAHA